MFKKLFVEHPDSVGESYFEHLCMAFSFSGRMFAGAVACLIHGLIPGLFTSTGSRAIACLHDRMVTNRNRKAHQRPEALVAERQQTALN